MTFFLKDQPDIQRRGPNVALPSNSEGVGAGMRSYFQSVNVAWQRERQVIAERDMTAIEAAKAMGPEGLAAFTTEFNDRAASAGLQGRTLSPNMTPDEIVAAVGPNGSKRLMEMARERAAVEPDKFATVDLTDEGIEARVTEKRKAEAAADAEILALSPNPVRNSIVGGVAAGLVDPVNLALLPFGLGPGSLLRVIGREAMLGGAAEVIQYPTRTRVAEELDQEAPGFVESVSMGVIAGGVFGGVLEGIPRAVRGYALYEAAKRQERLPEVSPVTQEAGVVAASRAAAEGGGAMQAAAKVVLDEPPPHRRPLILDETMAVTPEPTALAPDPITTSPLDAPTAVAEPLPTEPPIFSQMGPDAISEEPAPANLPPPQPVTDATATLPSSPAPKARKEILGWLKRQGVDPQGWLGTELRTRGLTNKTNRGLFRKGGLKDIDNLVADEIDQSIPGLSWRAGRDDTGNYLDREGLIRLVEEEISGPRKAYNRDYMPERAYADPDPEARGWLVNDLEARKFAEPETWRETLGSDLDAYTAQTGRNLLPRERDEILGILSTRGGDAEDLIYSAMSREIDEAEYATVRAQRGEAYGQQTRDVPWGEEGGVGPIPDSPGGSIAVQPETPSGNAAEPGARGSEFAVERTDIGDQYVITGAERVAPNNRQREEAELAARQLQSKMRRLNQARVEDDVDGLFATKTMDMFDDLTSPKAMSYMDAEIANMRADLEAGDLPLTAVADDGLKLNSLADILDEIDETDALMREFAKCRGGATE